jgi:DNA-binding beta-propeller fold protein YncE
MLLGAGNARADQLLFVTNPGTSSITVADWDSDAGNNVIGSAEVPMSATPWAVVAHPDGMQAFATAFTSNGGSVWTIDGLNNVATPLVTGNGAPSDIAITSDGAALFVAALEPHLVTRVEVATLTMSHLALQPTDLTPTALALSADNTTLAVGSDQGVVNVFVAGTLVAAGDVQDAITDILIEPSGLIRVSGQNGNVYALNCNTSTGRCRRLTRAQAGPLGALAHVPFTGVLAALPQNGQVVYADSAGLFAVSVPSPHGLAFDVQSRYTFVGSHDDAVFLFHVDDVVPPWNALTLPAGSDPNDLALGSPIPSGLLYAQSAPGVSSTWSRPYETTAVVNVDFRNIGVKQVKTGLALVTGDAERFIIDDRCSKRELFPGELCRIAIRCFPVPSGDDLRPTFKAQLTLPSNAVVKTNKLTLVCAPAKA